MLPALTGAPDPAVAALLSVLLVLVRVGGEGVVPLAVVGDSETCLRSAPTEVSGEEKDLSFGPLRFLGALLSDLGFWWEGVG